MAAVLVCGVDGSLESREAATVAARLAKRLELGLVLVNAVPDSTSHLFGEVSRERLRHTSLRDGERLLGRVTADIEDDQPVLRRAELGDPATAVLDVADELDAALIVVGSRGRGAAAAALLGSVSWRLIEDSDRPVVVVPPGASGGFRTGAAAICGVDLDGHSGPATRAAAAVCRRLGVPLKLVHVADREVPVTAVPASPGVLPIDVDALQRERRTAAINALENAERQAERVCPVSVHLASGTPAERLAELAADDRCILLFVGTRGHGRVRGALAGSVSGQLCAAAPCPVVVVPDAEGLGSLEAALRGTGAGSRA